MTGRGTRGYILSIAISAAIMAAAMRVDAVPELSNARMPSVLSYSFSFNHLCQDAADEASELSKYFTAPEHDGHTTYVFYNKYIDPVSQETEFGYALLYGFELVSEKAAPDDTLAVGFYFTTNKGKIYGIKKKAYDAFTKRKMTVSDLLQYLSVKEVNLTDLAKVGKESKNR